MVTGKHSISSWKVKGPGFLSSSQSDWEKVLNCVYTQRTEMILSATGAGSQLLCCSGPAHGSPEGQSQAWVRAVGADDSEAAQTQ